MAGRPSVNHKGFLVPNAADVNDPVMAEPDRIDFNTVAHAQYGVIEGCEVLVDVLKATTAGGTAIVNGKLVGVPYREVTLTTGGTQDRFDLIVVNDSGALEIHQGTPSIDPVFPDTPENTTLLAVVFAPSNQGDFNENIIDKRKFLPKALLTKISADDMLVANRNGTGNYYSINGQGDMAWTGSSTRRPTNLTGIDAKLYRVEPFTIRIERNLEIDRKLWVGDDGISTPGPVTALGRISGANLKQGNQPPTAAYPSAPLGSIYQQDDGCIYVMTQAGWTEIGTVTNTAPPGTIIESLQGPDVMIDLGWLPMNGSAYSEDLYPRLFTVSGLQGRITGTAPHRSVTLPNMNRRVKLTDFDNPGVTGGSNSTTLTTDHLPPHRHRVNIVRGGGATLTGTTRPAGRHKHVILEGGAHPHSVSDPGHRHPGFDFNGNMSAICVVVDGPNSIDARFNDRNHPLTAAPILWIASAKTGIRVLADGSEHKHEMDAEPDHVHTVDIPDLTQHDHTVQENLVGEGRSFTNLPAFLTVYTYIRS